MSGSYVLSKRAASKFIRVALSGVFTLMIMSTGTAFAQNISKDKPLIVAYTNNFGLVLQPLSLGQLSRESAKGLSLPPPTIISPSQRGNGVTLWDEVVPVQQTAATYSGTLSINVVN